MSRHTGLTPDDDLCFYVSGRREKGHALRGQLSLDRSWARYCIMMRVRSEQVLSSSYPFSLLDKVELITRGTEG